MTHLMHWARRVRFTHSRRAMVALSALGLCVALVAAFLVVGTTFAAPPSSSITLSPSAAPPGASVSVSGANFGCKSVDLGFDGASVGAASPTKKAFSATITVPSAATAGEHTVTANCAGQKSDKNAAQAPFHVIGANLFTRIVGTDVFFDTQPDFCFVSIVNNGPDPASNVVVRFSIDEAPHGLPSYFPMQFVTTDIGSGSYDPDTRQWTVGTLGPDRAARLTCTLTMPASTFAWHFHLIALASSDTPNTIATQPPFSVDYYPRTPTVE